MKELKPCPLCGGVPEQADDNIRCRTCGLLFRFPEGDDSWARNRWNTRSATDVLQAKIHAYQKALMANTMAVSFYVGITNSLLDALDSAGLVVHGLDDCLSEQKALHSSLTETMKSLEKMTPDHQLEPAAKG